MSTPPDAETLFQFDPYDGLSSGASPVMQLKPESEPNTTPPMSSYDEPSTPGELDLGLEILVQPTITKGKEITRPMAIRASSIVYDLFDSSPPSVASSSSFRACPSSSSSAGFTPSSFSFSSPADNASYRQHGPSVDSMEQLDASDIESSSLNSPPSFKGKEKESFSFLPPLTFSLIQLNPDHGVLATPCESPYDRPRNDRHSPQHHDSANQILPTLSLSESSSSERNSNDPQEKHSISRSQSFPDSAQQLSVPSGASSVLDRLSMTGPSRTPSNLSLMFEKRDTDCLSYDFSDKPSKPAKASTPTLTPAPGIDSGNDSANAWYTVASSCGLPLIQTQPLAIPSLPEQLLLNSSTRMLLEGKSHYISSSYPLSALDLVPNTFTDIFQPLPIVIHNYFDLSLPKELRLQIFRDLIHVHERDYLGLVGSGHLTVAKASSSRSRWVGRDRGIRELFKLSRVCFRAYLDI